MDLTVYEENKPSVLQALHEGDFDSMEGAAEVFETEFFRYIGARKILDEAARTYPTPRAKHEVPLWFYIASDLSMRLHGVRSFREYPTVVQTGGMLNAFAPKTGHVALHPHTGELTVACQGFNGKNHYDRQTPCDHDYLRKLARDTDAEGLMGWYNRDIVKILRDQRAFDSEGIFIGDASYLFVPDNPAYEGSVCLLFDEHNHPVGKEELQGMSDEQKLRCKRRRCYKMVTLLHTNRKQDYFLFVGVKVVSGKDSECPLLYAMVREFVEATGTGVMKKLILDRGFLDGKEISDCKEKLGIDVLIPLRKRMDVYVDAMALFQAPDVEWVVRDESGQGEKFPEKRYVPRFRPLPVRKREHARQKTLAQTKETQPPPSPATVIVRRDAAAIGGFTSWSTCSVPLSVVANREHYADGHEETWLLVTTQDVRDPRTAGWEYHWRTAVEERYRQLKCFADLTGFTSRAFSLIVNQVVFVMLAYSLLQHYLYRQKRADLNSKTPPTVRRQLTPIQSYIIICWKNSYGLFSNLEWTELLTMHLGEEARRKIGEKCQRLRRGLSEAITNPRPT
jgi:hypothetical protein